MKATFLEHSLRVSVVCPLCKGSLEIKRAVRHNDVIQRAILSCVSCKTLFRIYARIPVLLEPGQRADWNHPFVEALFGYTTEPYEKLLEKYGIDRIRRRYSEVIKGEYSPPKVFFKEPVDRSLLAMGGWRIRKCSIERHLERIKRQTEHNEALKEMVYIVKDLSPSRILDMCSGGGFFLAHLLEKYREFRELYSFDIDYKCAKRIEGILMYYGLLNKSLPLVTDARAMPFRQNYFDIITNNCGFGQILGYSRALRETYRALRHGGKLVVREIYGITRWDSSRTRKELGFSVDELVEFYKRYDIYIDKESFIAALEKIGFSIELIKDFKESYLIVCTK